MAVEYIWTWGPMKVETVNGIDNVVTGIQWSCVAKDPSISDTITGVESGIMLTPPVNPENYITISELTDAIVNSWIDISMDKPTIESKVLAILTEQLTSKTSFVTVPLGVNPISAEEIPIEPVTPSPLMS